MTTITRSKPFYVVAGAGDLAVKTVRDLPGMLRPSRIVTVKVQRQDVVKAVSAVTAGTLAVPGKAQDATVAVAVGAADRVDAVYETLLGRGRRVVGRIRRQKATQELKRDAGATVRRTKAATTVAAKGAADTRTAAKATRTTATKSTAQAVKAAGTSTRSSAKRTATTARKRAAGTRTATKSATTAARKTAKSAARATSAGAAKVGR